MSSKVFKYILDFQGNTQKISQQIGGVKGLMKGAAVAAGAMFAVDKIMDAADAVADYAKEISGVRTEIGKLTGAEGSALNSMTGQIESIAKVYDQDVTEAIKASNAMMRTFGVDSKETFDIINAGFATTANSNDDFLKQVSEYSAHFKEAGLQASEMVAIIAEGNKMGVFDDKAADSIKEGSIRLREMTQGTRDALDAIGLSSTKIQQEISAGNVSMFEVMQRVSRQLNTLPAQAPAVGQALADIFGGPGEDAVQFIRSLGDMNTSLVEIIRQAGGAAAAQMQLTEETAKFHELGAQVFGGTNAMIAKVKATMMGWVNDGIRGVVNMINYFIDLYNESTLFRARIQQIKFTFQSTFDFVGTVLKTLWEQLKSTGKLITAIFERDLDGVKESLKEVFGGNAIEQAKGFGERTAQRFKDGWEEVVNPREKINPIVIDEEAVHKAGVDAANNFAQGFIKGSAKISTDFSVDINKDELNAFDNIGGNLDLRLLEIEEPDLSIVDKFVEDYGANMDKNTKKANQLSSAMQGFLNPEGIGAMSENFGILGQNIGGAAGSFLGFASNMLQLIPQMIMQIMALGSAEVAQATATTSAKSGEAVASGVAQSQKVPFPLNLIALAATMAAVVGALSSAKSFATGGIVPGISYHGDNVLARLNSGEEVLRRDDPRHSFNQRGTQSGNSGGRDRLILGDVKWSKGALYFALREAENQLYKRTGRKS